MSVFTRAAELIKEKGWRQGEGAFNPEDGVFEDYCLMDAIWDAEKEKVRGTIDPFNLPPEYDATNRYMLRHYDNLGVGWNDTEGRTVDEVFALLEELDRELESNPNSLD